MVLEAQGGFKTRPYIQDNFIGETAGYPGINNEITGIRENLMRK